MRFVNIERRSKSLAFSIEISLENVSRPQSNEKYETGYFEHRANYSSACDSQNSTDRVCVLRFAFLKRLNEHVDHVDRRLPRAGLCAIVVSSLSPSASSPSSQQPHTGLQSINTHARTHTRTHDSLLTHVQVSVYSVLNMLNAVV